MTRISCTGRRSRSRHGGRSNVMVLLVINLSTRYLGEIMCTHR